MITAMADKIHNFLAAFEMSLFLIQAVYTHGHMGKVCYHLKMWKYQWDNFLSEYKGGD